MTTERFLLCVLLRCSGMHRRVDIAKFDQRQYIASSRLTANLTTELIGLLQQVRAVCMVSSLSLQATSKTAAHRCLQAGARFCQPVLPTVLPTVLPMVRALGFDVMGQQYGQVLR